MNKSISNFFKTFIFGKWYFTFHQYKEKPQLGFYFDWIQSEFGIAIHIERFCFESIWPKLYD